jgi:hypothetical protein
LQYFPDKETLDKYLTEHLNLCECASGYTWHILYRTLQIIEQRSAPDLDKSGFGEKTIELKQLLQLEGELGLGEWFVYFLESKKLITHNFNTADCWITEQGALLLKAMDEYGNDL